MRGFFFFGMLLSVLASVCIDFMSFIINLSASFTLDESS